MLVLQRKTSERIYLTNKQGQVVAIVTAVRILGDAMKIGIDAPNEFQIHRDDYALNNAKVGEQLILRGRE